ncbi:MAG: hypothetical protein QM706_01380 [Nitrospira sp.]
MEGLTADFVGERSLMNPSGPSSSILLVEPDPGLREIIHRFFPAVVVDVCASFAEAAEYLSLNHYQAVICPQRIASREQYSLLRLNQLHNSCAPFIITTDRDEAPDVQQAIDQGALGFLPETATTPTIIRTIEGLLVLYGLRFSLACRWKWLTDYRDQLRNNGMQEKSGAVSVDIREKRIMFDKTLVAIEDSILSFRVQADDLAREARLRMWDTGS